MGMTNHTAEFPTLNSIPTILMSDIGWYSFPTDIILEKNGFIR